MRCLQFQNTRHSEKQTKKPFYIHHPMDLYLKYNQPLSRDLKIKPQNQKTTLMRWTRVPEKATFGTFSQLEKMKEGKKNPTEK